MTEFEPTERDMQWWFIEWAGRDFASLDGPPRPMEPDAIRARIAGLPFVAPREDRTDGGRASRQAGIRPLLARLLGFIKRF